MTEQEWWGMATANESDLVDLIREFHPVNRQPGRRPQDWITAPTAEAACVQVRKDIRKNFEGDPVAQFHTAIEARNMAAVTSILNGAWFGVPESRECWRIPGFKVLVNLLDDPPDADMGDG